jgi:GNAT superfamily N-acetyltransferase
MIDPFAQPAWAESHEKFSADVAAGLARLARWLGRRAEAKEEIPAVAQGADRRNDRAIRPGARQGAADVAIAPEPATGTAALYCLGEYYRELGDRFDGGFDPELSLFPALDELAPPRGIFLVARLHGRPVGCGGLKPISAEAAYLKRMWIAPDARGLGLARRLLSALEEQAGMLGYSVVRLETNKTLVEAQQLYRSSGYREVPPFNDEPYAHHWFEKALHRGMGRRPRGRAPRADARRISARTAAPHVSGASMPRRD